MRKLDEAVLAVEGGCAFVLGVDDYAGGANRVCCCERPAQRVKQKTFPVPLPLKGTFHGQASETRDGHMGIPGQLLCDGGREVVQRDRG